MKFLFPFCIAALSVVRPSIPTCLLSVQPLVFLLLTGTSGLAGIDAASDVTAEDIKATNLRGSAEPLPVESIVRRQTQELLGDWALCSASDQCINGCCSSMYSHDNLLKCTPLDNGFQSDICISWTSGGGTCGNGYVGDGRCSDGSCCSIYGWCGTGAEHCSVEGYLPVWSPTMSPRGMLPVPVPPTTSNDIHG